LGRTTAIEIHPNRTGAVLATVHVLSKRYADLDRARPFIASIIITPIGRSQS
jgi:hypothetical protein